jgi:ABC-2 type transport system permease protein
VTTITASPASAGTVLPHAVDPAAVVARTRPRTTITETVSQTLIMAWRALKKMRRNMEQFFDVTIQPLLFTAMFAYLFGGAISGNVHSYLPLLIPGIVAHEFPLPRCLRGSYLRWAAARLTVMLGDESPTARGAPARRNDWLSWGWICGAGRVWLDARG